MYAKNVTLIKDLPDIDEMEQNINNKFIRNGHKAPQESGMHERPQHGVQHGQSDFLQNQPRHNQSDFVQHGQSDFLQNQPRHNQSDFVQQYPQQRNRIYEHYEKPDNINVNRSLTVDSPDQLNCRSLIEHFTTCPLCSRYFKNDNTVYIIIITILTIILAILLKKILNA